MRPLKCEGCADTVGAGSGNFREIPKRLKRQAGLPGRAQDLQNLSRFGLARGGTARHVPGQRRRCPRRLHSFFHSVAGGRDGEEAFLRPDRAVPDRGRCRRAGGRAEVGTLAQRRIVSASLRRTRSRRGHRRARHARAVRWLSRHPGVSAVIRAFDAFSLPLLRWFDPEDAHRLAIQGLRLLPPMRPRPDDAKLAVRAFGLNFPNPIGMAAGFDKSAEAPDALLRLGFGFVEIGTVTPKPPGGDPPPRLFRLERDEAVVNRMGFNNDGADAVLRRLAARAHLGGIVGVNVGANKDSADRAADYVKLIETFAPVASYFTVNVSSPNTPGLRNLQQASALDDLLAKVIDARERVRQNAGDSPVLLKIAPDLSLTELDDVVHIARSRRVDGMIVANTTTMRPSTLRELARAKEQGGLSGRPLFRLSTRMVAETYVRAEGAFPLVGVGGINSGGAALTKIRAGASLIQLYSSLTYKGLGLVDDIKNDLASTLLRTGRDALSEIVGADAATITAEDWPV